MSEKKRKRRMTLPKKADDLQKIVEEVEESHPHDHHHHHHHHGEIDELLLVLELLVDSINANVNTLSSRVTQNSYEIARLYKILAYLVKALASDSDEEKEKHLQEAAKLLAKVEYAKQYALQ